MKEWIGVMAAALVVLPLAGARAEMLALSDCLRIGQENNRVLQQMMIEAAIAEQQVEEAGGVYDSRFTLDAAYEDSELPSSRTPIEGSSETFIAGAGLHRTFDRGTTVGLEAATRSFIFPDAGFGPDEIDISSLGISVRQPLRRNAWGRGDRARIEAAEAGVRSARQEVLRQRDLVAAEIHDVYWNVYLADGLHRVNQRTLDLSRRLAESNHLKFEDGLLEESEVLAADAALATHEVEVLRLREAVFNQTDLLLDLLGLPGDRWEEMAIALPDEAALVQSAAAVDAVAAYKTALATRPDMRALREAENRARALVVARADEARALVDLFGGVRQGASGNTYSDSLGLEETVWFVGFEWEASLTRRTETSRLRQRELELEQVRSRLDELQSQVLRDCRITARDARSSAERMAATRRARDLERRKLDLEEDKLRQGRTSTRVVIDYQEDLQHAEWAHVQALAEHQKRVARHLLAQGILVTPAADPPRVIAR